MTKTVGETKVWIPDLPEQQILEMAKRIKPVMRFNGGEKGGLRYIKPVDPFETAFNWSPEPAGEALGLSALCDITTYHTWAHYGLFKPTVAEVLAQIPELVVERVVAFEIVEKPETAADLNKEGEAFNAGYHTATTRLYFKR